MFRRAKLTAVAFAIGAMVLGVTAAPAVATVSDDDSPLVMHFGDPLQLSDYVISADGTTAYAFGTKNMTIDLATRTATEVPGQLVDRLLYQGAKVAVGPYWASPGQDDYALVTLGTNQVEYFADTQDHWPILNHMVADESGNVTAVSFEGDFLRFDGSAIISEKRIRPNDTFMVGQSGLSADGMLYFEAYNSADQPEITTTVIVDMRTGNQLGTMHSDSTKPFVPVLFDASNESLWGTYQDGNYELVNYDWQSGTAAHPP